MQSFFSSAVSSSSGNSIVLDLVSSELADLMGGSTDVNRFVMEYVEKSKSLGLSQRITAANCVTLIGGDASVVLMLLTDAKAFEGCGVNLKSTIDAHKIVSAIDAGKADQLKSRILEIYPYSTYFGAGYTVQSLDALYGTPGGVIV